MNRLVALPLALAICSSAFALPPNLTQQEAEQWNVPSISLDEQSVKGCRMTLMYPKVFEDVSCGNAASELGATFLASFYRYLDPAPDTADHVEGSFYRISLQDFMNSGGGDLFMRSSETDKVVRDENGFPKHTPIIGCAMPPRIPMTITPLKGSNWNGWMWEQPFKNSKEKVQKNCKWFTPAYRCALLVFGNDIMSAHVSYCLLRIACHEK